MKKQTQEHQPDATIGHLKKSLFFIQPFGEASNAVSIAAAIVSA